jgi:agmatinase
MVAEVTRPTLLVGTASAGHRIGLFGIPYDTSASLGRPGARYAPARIREALRWNLNRVRDGALFDVEARRCVRFGDVALWDYGDVVVSGHDHLATLDRARRRMAELLEAGVFPIVMGGDHSVSLPLLQAFHDHYEGPLGIIQLDAHLDLVDETPSQGRYSGSSQIRRALEMGRYHARRLVQVGVRGFNYPDQYAYVAGQGIHQITAADVHEKGGRDAAEAALEAAASGDAPVFFTLDIDCLDPAFAPGAGADEPGGLTSAQVLAFVRRSATRVQALDIVEVNPLIDRHETTSALAAQIIFTAVAARAGGD